MSEVANSVRELEGGLPRRVFASPRRARSATALPGLGAEAGQSDWRLGTRSALAVAVAAAPRLVRPGGEVNTVLNDDDAAFEATVSASFQGLRPKAPGGRASAGSAQRRPARRHPDSQEEWSKLLGG